MVYQVTSLSQVSVSECESVSYLSNAGCVSYVM
jgi:hypothetical protein